MKATTRRPRGRDYVDGLAAAGRHLFTSTDAQNALGVSAEAAKLALNRLIRHGVIASPARGFYVIVPPEYRTLGCLPAEQFIPALMQRIGEPYYAGLLSAAQYHGAAHHRPQEFQVLLLRPRRPIRCGRVRVTFVVRKRLRDVSVQDFNTPRGTIQISTPEATAVDLVGYHRVVGGLDQVATVLTELIEQIRPQELVAAAQTGPLAWAQRLGYLLEHVVGASDRAIALKEYVKPAARQAVPLLPGASRVNARRDPAWKVIINTHLEAEL